jgi:MoaA/NifB/PqqE/SkfB family radical SAM enzyme
VDNDLSGPNITMHATLTSLNVDYLDKLVELASALGCDAIDAGNLVDVGPTYKSFCLTDEQKAALPDHLHRASERARELGITDHFAMVLVDRPCVSLEDFRNASGLLRAMCFEPWLSIAVHADGRVGPCCLYWEQNAGSLMNDTLEAIWLGSHLRNIRKAVLKGRLPGFCAKCAPAPASLGIRDTLLRKELVEQKQEIEKREWMNARWPQRVRILFGKSLASLRRCGVLGALRRGKEWLQIH